MVNELKEKTKWVIIFRALIFFVLLIATLIFYGNSYKEKIPQIILINSTFILILSVIYYALVIKNRFIKILVYLQLIIDIIVWSQIILITGGGLSAFSILYTLSITTGAFLLGLKGAVIISSFSFASFVTITYLGNINLKLFYFFTNNEIRPINLSHKELLSSWILNGAAYFLVSFLTGYLAEREKKSGGSIRRLKQIQAELVSLNESIIKSLPQGLITLDKNNIIFFINEKGREILQFEENEIIGKHISEIIPAIIINENSLLIQREETEAKRKNNLFPIGYSLANLTSSNGESTGKICIFQDLTAMKNLEIELNKTKKLATLGEIASSIAHEIRNPIGSISGCLELIKSLDNKDEEKELIDIASEELKRILALINNMLELSKPRLPNKINVDIIPIVNKVIKLLSLNLKNKVAWDLVLPDKLEVLIDPNQFEQIIWNLLNNSLNVIPGDGYIKININKQSDHWETIIEDNGPGIPEELKDKIFEPFNSLRQGGIGLGLAVCKQLVTSHNGNISIKNKEKNGIIVKITFPL